MVWAGVFHDGRTQLKIVQGILNVVKYRDDILDPIVLLQLVTDSMIMPAKEEHECDSAWFRKS
jgi:hypothetical protein